MPEQKEIRSNFYSKIAEFTDENSHDIEPHQMQKIADYWLEVISTLRTQEREEIEALKKEYGEHVFNPDYEKDCREVDIHNEAIDSVLEILP